MTDCIPLDHLTSDQLDALYDDRDRAQRSATHRLAVLSKRREQIRALEAENATLRDAAAHCRHKARVAELEQQLDDATGELAEARDHNERTCEAVHERDRLRTENARLTAGQCTHALHMCQQHPGGED